MASLRMKEFYVEVFLSVGPLMSDPWVVYRVTALLEETVLLQVLAQCGLVCVPCLYIVHEGGQGAWLHNVRLGDGCLMFDSPVHVH